MVFQTRCGGLQERELAVLIMQSHVPLGRHAYQCDAASVPYIVSSVEGHDGNRRIRVLPEPPRRRRTKLCKDSRSSPKAWSVVRSVAPGQELDSGLENPRKRKDRPRRAR